MFTRKKTTIICIITVISIGFLLIINYFNINTSKNKKFKLMIKEIVFYCDKSSKAYHNEQPEVAIEVLKHYIKLLKVYRNQLSKNTKIQSIFPLDSVKIELMFSYTRLFFLYSKSGNNLKAEKYMSQALEVNMTKAKTRIALINFVKKNDLLIKNKQPRCRCRGTASSGR
jgi:hypothetical protein